MLALVMTACVSKKKYAELEAQLATESTKREIGQVRKTDELKTAEEYEAILADMQQEMDGMYQRMELAMTSYEAASGEPFDPSKAQEILEQRNQETHEGAGAGNQALMEELAKQETRMRFTKAAFEKVLKNYSGSQMKMTQDGGRLVISIKKGVLFSGDDSELSPQGETAVNRLAAAFAVQNDFRVLIMGVNEGEAKPTTLLRAGAFANALGQRMELKDKVLIPSSISCEEAYGDFGTCDRFEIVLEQDYEAAVGTLRYTPKY